METRATNGRTFAQAYRDLAGFLLHSGSVVDTGHWQAMTDVPQTNTIELTGMTFHYDIPSGPAQLASDVRPSTPWAEAQFRERVSGEPLNPGRTYQLWPWFRGNVPQHQDEEEKFSHTYMERFWPRLAGDTYLGGYGIQHQDQVGYGQQENLGIRYRYGDLNDVIKLLARQPFTRQAYLPVFFPEDTGAHHEERIPCTLGYHLMRRSDKLHVFYPIRSCDFFRHFADDVYMAARLVQWVIDQLTDNVEEGNARNSWNQVYPGRLVMSISSLHVFEPERAKLRKLAYTGAEQTEGYGAAV
jgi:hypothetical protein